MIFFFKQKTAYELRISDWSSDVCSSDLWCLRHRPWVLIAFLLTVVGTVYLYVAIPKDFIPGEDSGRLIAYPEGPEEISFEAMARHQRELAAIVRAAPDIAARAEGGSGGQVVVSPCSSRWSRYPDRK